MFEVRSYDPDLQRKGHVLAIMLLGMVVGLLVLAIFNLIQGETQYNVSNAVFISLIIGLFMLNRFGFVRAAALFTVALTAAGSFTMSENLTAVYLTMTLPILIASYLLASWSGFAVSALMIVSAIVLGIANLSLLNLIVVAIISYLLTESLNRAYRENRYRALHDDLTGLPNRTLFIYRLQQAIDRSDRDGNLRAVLFMDLDQFKVINDSLGHETGDELLIMVARRLQAGLRPGDTVARFGGDEFAVLLNGIADVSDAVRAAELIAKALEAPFELRGRQIFIGTSIGIMLIRGGDEKPDALLRSADIAMYEAKKEARACCKVFNSDMYARALERLELENEVRRAIEHGGLRVYYQPKVLLSTGRITGVEALVRWEHPKRGLVSPVEFIPLAEETGLIVSLGRWVLREACRQTREWRRQYPTAPPLVTGINLSIKQFRDPNLIQELAEILEETGLDPGYLQLEITESVVADDVEYAVGLLQRLKGLGVKLAMDDFGTGYSSLVSLQQFPLDELKVDRAFVGGLGEDTRDAAIAQLVIGLAHAMGMQAVAEGVETLEQLLQLRDMGCDQAQGFYFWKPLTGEAATALLTESYQHHLTEHFRHLGMFLEGRRYSDPG